MAVIGSGVLAKGALAEMVKRPALWPTAFSEWRAMTPTKWWRRWPPAPVPSRDYLRFRLQTMYGSPAARLEPEDLVTYLEWCRWMRSRAR
jgi:hypothetical protein